MSLSPSQRISLIKEIAARYSNEEYSLIDLTLEQFTLPTAITWNGSKYDYVIHHTKNAPDSSLIELARHVGLQIDESAKQRLDPPFWRKGMLRVFISHLATFRKSAGELQESLLKLGISGFVAHSDLEPTVEWQTQIETALATCDALIALLHPGFHESKWTDQETGFAMGRGVPVFSIRFGEDPYGFIGRFQAFNGNGKTSQVLVEELFEVYVKHKQTHGRMSDVLVGLFEESNSFAEAKTRIGYLESLDTWDPSFSKRIRIAVESNSQVSGSWGVPERVEALIKKWKKSS